MAAARRELAEETGLAPALFAARGVTIDRDVAWNGERRVGPEQLFVASLAEEEPPIVLTGLLPDERANLIRYAWIDWSDLAAVSERVEPPELLEVLRALVPDGPWAA